MTQVPMKELHDLVESVLHAEKGKHNGVVELFINQGGVQNRDISSEGRAAIREGFRRYCAAANRPMSSVKGRICCNLAEGRLNGLAWHIEPYQTP